MGEYYTQEVISNMASMVKMTREDELVYVFNHEVFPAFESDDQARQGKIYCAAMVALNELVNKYGYDSMANTLQQFQKLTDTFSDEHQCIGEVGIIHTLIRHDVDRRLISDETLSNARLSLHKLVNDYKQDYWKELHEETERWYEQRNNDNKSHKNQRFEELNFMLDELVSNIPDSMDPMYTLMILVVSRELIVDHEYNKPETLVDKLLQILPTPIPPQLLLAAQVKVELALIASGHDRPEIFSLAAHWCQRLIDDYGQDYHKTLESILSDAKKRGYTIDKLNTPDKY